MGWAVIVLGCSINLGLYMSGVVCELRYNLTTCIAHHVAIAPHDSCNTAYSDPLLPVRHHSCASNRLLTGYFFVIQKAESASTVAPHPHRCGDVTELVITSATHVVSTIKWTGKTGLSSSPSDDWWVSKCAITSNIQSCIRSCWCMLCYMHSSPARWAKGTANIYIFK